MITAAPEIKPGSFVSILARPWEDFVLGQSKFKRDLLWDLIWWGYKVEAVNGDRVTIVSVNAPTKTKIRETVPAECLEIVTKRPDNNAPPETIEPYSIGARVMYLYNRYEITAVYKGKDGKPEYDLKQLDPELKVWKGDRVWHSAIDLI